MHPEIAAAEFPGMGGVIEVQAVAGGPVAIASTRALFASCEAALSRFIPDGELCALNRAAGRPFAASPLLFEAVNEAVGWACATDGIFDPTVIDDLEAAGYDRPFDALAPTSATATRAQARHATKRWRAIDFDVERNLITLPRGVRIDLGGIGKGFTVDRAMTAFGLSANALVNASGDLYAAGAGPDGHGWYVGVQDPFDLERDVCLLNVSDRGVATSGSINRHWTIGDRRYHHLIDTRRGTSSDSELLTVTTIALTATHADVLAKTAFLLGPAAGIRFVERFPDAECIAITSSGDVFTTSGIPDYLA